MSIKCLSVLSICVLQNDLDSETLLPAMHNENVKAVDLFYLYAAQ